MTSGQTGLKMGTSHYLRFHTIERLTPGAILRCCRLEQKSLELTGDGFEAWNVLEMVLKQRSLELLETKKLGTTGDCKDTTPGVLELLRLVEHAARRARQEGGYLH